MTAEILQFTGDTTVDEEPNEILEKAKGWKLDVVFICGWSGDKFIAGGSHSDVGNNLILLELAKRNQLDYVESISE